MEQVNIANTDSSEMEFDPNAQSKQCKNNILNLYFNDLWLFLSFICLFWADYSYDYFIIGLGNLLPYEIQYI